MLIVQKCELKKQYSNKQYKKNDLNAKYLNYYNYGTKLMCDSTISTPFQ